MLNQSYADAVEIARERGLIQAYDAHMITTGHFEYLKKWSFEYLVKP